MTLEEVQKYCKQLKGVTEDIKWEDHLCFCVGQKMFLITAPDDTPVSASFKASDEDFEELTARPGFKPAPYMARNKWIFIEDIQLMTPAEWKHYIDKSYELIKGKLPKKILKEQGLL